ncbi:MAG: hypothetical protein HFJ33_07645 [Clostridia bacterium]|nr:hypothetical protein [Clostridia bacterium]
MEENKTQQPAGGKSIASFVLGIVGMIAWLIPLFGYPVTITGLVLGCIARKNEKNGFSLAGIILSSIALGLTLINSILGVILALSLYY